MLRGAASDEDIFYNNGSLFGTRQFLVQTLELKREALVVNAEAVQNSGLEVAYVHGVFDDVVGNSSVSPWTKPPLIPPPAIQIEKHRG